MSAASYRWKLQGARVCQTEVSLIILPPPVFSAVTRYDQLLAAVWLKDASRTRPLSLILEPRVRVEGLHYRYRSKCNSPRVGRTVYS